MKKFLSLALVLAMVMLVVPFSAFSADAAYYSSEYAYDIPQHSNIALGKYYSTSRTDAGVTSAYHPINCNANLTDGIVSDDYSADAFNNNSWFAFQTYTNTVVEHGTYGTVGEVNLDLGAVYDVTSAKVHILRGNFLLSDGYTLISDVWDITFYGKKNANDEYIKLDDVTATYPNAYWEDFNFSCEEIRYIKVTIGIDLFDYESVEPVIYMLLDEIEVYGVLASENYYENLALNATYQIYDDNGNVVKPTRGYTGKLNDGIMNVPLVSHLYNSKTGKYNANDGKWFGLFSNENASDENLPDGSAYIIIDLGQVAQVEFVNIFEPKDCLLAPTNVFSSFSMDGVNFNIRNFDGRGYYGSEYKYGIYETYHTAVECRYIKITMDAGMFWGIFNEIKIMGRYTDFNLASGKSYTMKGVYGEEINPTRGYTGNLTDGVSDVPVVSHLYNPNTGAYNCNDGKWFGFFRNPATPEENCTIPEIKVTIDLEQNCDIDEVRVFISNDRFLAPRIVGPMAFDENMNSLTYGSSCNIVEGVNGDWWCFSLEGTTEGVRYIQIEFVFDYYWCLFNEIEVIGTYS